MDVVKDLFRNAENYESKLEKAEKGKEELGINGPYTVIDPRRVGYEYISYSFIESGADLPEITENPEKISTQFQDSTINNGLLVGTSLGSFDIIHRRTEQKQYTHAKFAVDSIDDDEINYIQSIETYPIWAIARWHGQDIPKNKLFNDRIFNNKDDPNLEIDLEILYELNENPNKDTDQVAENIEQRVKSNQTSVIDSLDDLDDRHYDLVDRRDSHLKNEKINLGSSIGLTVNELDLHHVMVGLQVEEIRDNELTKEKEELQEAIGQDRGPLPNEIIMRKLVDEFDDGWEMPYIVSGVGQNWADILVEMHIDDAKEMNEHADKIRNIPGIKSTRTQLITHEADNQPLIVENPNYLD